ncbi:MAG: phenylalanyl-tRNA synthetase beta chain [Thermoplasmata archaeon]|jgi:phenylalanyl-tRNA synthetase beta chain|nr:phenylalanyl-tRNA synthetase beta chain [Thermoplasmata archaeon]
MPVVTFQASDLCRLIGKKVPTQELAERMPMMGGDLDKVVGDAITIEWFPNRPDLLVLEGTGRALRAFLDVKPGLPEYPVAPPKTELRVDPMVQAVRPYAALCFVRGVPFDDAYVQAVIDAQEKLTFSPGRKRRKVAIGVHDASGLKGPFKYTCVGPSEKPFTPLNDTAPRTPEQILRNHPKGLEYGHLLPQPRASSKTFPVFLDGDGQVLSMPPIINAARTAVTAKTRDLLLDVTGTDLRSVKQTIALLATCFAERGGAIEAVSVHDGSGAWTCPELKPSEHVLHTDDVAALLGLHWTGDQVAACLRRMGHEATAYDNKVHVKVGAWRQDILHPVDLLEDVGIGFGFDRFPGDLPTTQTFAARLPLQDLEDALRSLMVGHGWHEARTLTLSDTKQQWTHWGDEPRRAVTVLNPVVEDQTLLRQQLVPSLLHVLANNRHRSLPQRLFEAGYTVHDDRKAWRNHLHFAGVELSAKAGFSEAKGLVEALVRDARLDAVLEPGTRPGLIEGRQGRIVAHGIEVGWFGELHPDTLVAFGLGAPGYAFEMDLEPFLGAKP